MDATPLVSFYVPVYNGAPHLREALDSILSQTFGDWECIVVDDCSADESPRILSTYRDARFRIVRQPANLNVANASNLALRLARGRYLARLDQDDIAMTGRLEQQVAFLEEHADVVVLGSAMDVFGTQEGIAAVPHEDSAIKANLLRGLGVVNNPTSIVRTEFVRTHGIVNDPRYPLSCDYGMWVDCTLAGAKFANLPAALTRYRTHETQSSQDMSELVKGVISAKTRLLLAWFPELTYSEVVAVEPLLRVNGMVFISREAALAGVAVCAKVASREWPSVHGEDRARVRDFFAERQSVWQGFLDGN
jgi:glycosyltransferase involved in cell wall biosynthesis